MDTAIKQTEKLTEAVLNLTKRMQRAEELSKKSQLLGKSINVKETIKNKLADVFSLKTVGSMMGLGSHTMIGKILEARHEGIKEKDAAAKTEVEKAKAFAENQAKYTPEGQELAEKSQEAAIKHGVEMYEKQKFLLIEIQKIKEQIRNADETGHGEAARVHHANDLKNLESEYKEIVNPSGQPKKGPAKMPKVNSENTTNSENTLSQNSENTLSQNSESVTKLTSVAEDSKETSLEEIQLLRDALIEKGEVYKHAITELENNSGGTLSNTERDSVEQGIREGMDEELLALNREQLDALKKLVAAQPTEEEKLEARKKDPEVVVEKEKEKEKEKKGGIFDKITDIVSLFKPGNLVKALGGVATKLISPLLKAGSVVTKLVSGSFNVAKGLGSTLVSGGANLAKSGISKLAGVVPSISGSGLFSNAAGKLSTVASSAGSKIGSITSAVGGKIGGAASTVGKLASSVGGKLGGAGSAASKLLTGAGSKLLTKAGPIGSLLDIGMGGADLLDGKAQEDMPSGWDILSPMRWGMYGGDKINKGVKSMTGGSSIGDLLADKFQNDPIAQMEKADQLSKVAKTPREGQIQSLMENTKRSQQIDAAAKKAETSSKASAPVIVNNQNVNNSTKASIMAPPVRNFEPSYNARLRSSFV